MSDIITNKCYRVNSKIEIYSGKIQIINDFSSANDPDDHFTSSIVAAIFSAILFLFDAISDATFPFPVTICPLSEL